MQYHCSTSNTEFFEYIPMRRYQATWLKALLDETCLELSRLQDVVESPVPDTEPQEWLAQTQGDMLVFFDSMSREAVEAEKERTTPEELQARYDRLLYHRAWLYTLLVQLERDIQASSNVLASLVATDSP